MFFSYSWSPRLSFSEQYVQHVRQECLKQFDANVTFLTFKVKLCLWTYLW